MLTDANGNERRGIEVYIFAEMQGQHICILWTVRGSECWLIACGCPHYEIGMSVQEYETIRDLMLAGF